jgi:hypothetical protein
MRIVVSHDRINAFFRRYYPADWDSAWEEEYCVQSYAKKYIGAAGFDGTIFPRMVCADGFSMSVQGHLGAYSQPRGDFADRYSQVEISTSPDAEPLFAPYKDATYGKDGAPDAFTIYGYVPVEIVEQVIEKHGGLKAMTIEAVTHKERGQ